MKAYGSGCIDPIFLTSALVGGEWSAPVALPPGARQGKENKRHERGYERQ
jgi:hypothetical protein